MMKHVILTGPTGAIGSALVGLLLGAGYEVTAVIRPGSSRRDSLPEDAHLKVHECALEELATLPAMLAREAGHVTYDAFIHMGWDGTTGLSRTQEDGQNTNIEYTLDAVEAAHDLGCKRFLFVGSQAEYGPVEIPLRGDLPANPVSAYGKAKYKAGLLSQEMCKLLGMDHVWVRVLSVYGPGEKDTSLISQMIDGLLRGESPDATPCIQTWDYLYSEDCAAGLMALMERGISGKIYPLGSGESRKLSSYVEDLRAEVMNFVDKHPECKIPRGQVKEINYGARAYNPDQVMHLTADISELTEDTGFRPRVSFRDGIRCTIESRAERCTERQVESQAEHCTECQAHEGKRISIIMPSYNAARTIEEALSSIRTQDYPEELIEILVIDGGSTDETRMLAKKYGAIVLDNPMRLPETAKRIGLEAATGDFAIYIDTDEYFTKRDSLSRRVEVFASHPEVKVLTSTGKISKTSATRTTHYANYVSDPFSYFVYHLNGNDRLAEMSRKYDYERFDEDSYVIFHYRKGENLPLFDAAMNMFDLSYVRSAYEKAESKHDFAANIFQFVVSTTRCSAMLTDDYIIHDPEESFGSFISKMKWRVYNNVFRPEGEGVGFAAREEAGESYTSRKIAYVVYSCTIVPVFLHSIWMSLHKRHISYMMHFLVNEIVMFWILWYMVLKILHITPSRKKGYGKKATE